jgi:RNA recognition motif-containing protein
MGNKLYVGNLPFSVTEDSLQQLFSQSGKVESATIITDRDTGRSKGFGFVEMSTEQEAADAITKFNGTDFEGRSITVNEARPKAPREGGGGGRGFGGGGGGGGRDRGAFDLARLREQLLQTILSDRKGKIPYVKLVAHILLSRLPNHR